MSQNGQPVFDDDDEQSKKRCCGCPIEANFRQAVGCPAILKIFEIVVGLMILILSCVVVIQRIDEEGQKFSCAGTFVAFITCVSLSLISSTVLLIFYICVFKSKTNERLKSWVKSLDLVSAIFMLIAFMLHLYILIKWQLNRLNTKNESIPYLGEMVTISCFTFINTILYFVVEFTK